MTQLRRVARAAAVVDRFRPPDGPEGDPLPAELQPAAHGLRVAYEAWCQAYGWRLVGGAHYAVASADAVVDHAALRRDVDDAFRGFVAVCREHGGPLADVPDPPLAHVPDPRPDPQSPVETEPDPEEPAAMSAAELIEREVLIERDALIDNRSGMRQALGRPSATHQAFLDELDRRGLVGPGAGRLL